MSHKSNTSLENSRPEKTESDWQRIGKYVSPSLKHRPFKRSREKHEREGRVTKGLMELIIREQEQKHQQHGELANSGRRASGSH